MTYNVGVHSYGGSAGEAMDPQALVTVATLKEAEAIVEAIRTHPANDHDLIGGVITEVKDTYPLADAMAKVFECYLFEEWEWDGCEDLSDEEWQEEIVNKTMDHIVTAIEKFNGV